MSERNDGVNTSLGEELPPIVTSGGLEDLARRMDLGKIYRGILRRMWLVILVSILSAVGSGYVGHRFARQQIAEAYVMYELEAPKFLPGGYPLGHFTMASAVELITLPSHLNAVRSILGLEYTEKELLDMIEVLPPLSDSNLINITVTTDNASLSVDIANTLASVVVKNAQDFARRQLKVAFDYYNNQSQALEKMITKKVEEISTFRRDHSFFDLNPEGAFAIKGLLDSEFRLTEAEQNYNSLLIQYENLRREAVKMPDQVVKFSMEDSPIRRRLNQAELALIEARTRYASGNPKIKVLEAEVSELHKMLQAPQEEGESGNNTYQQFEKNPVKTTMNLELVNLRGRLRSAQKLKEDLTVSLAEREKEMDNLPAEEMEFTRLLSEKLRYEEELKTTEVVMKAAEMMLKVGKGDLELYLSATKASPKESLLLDLLPLIGFIFGIMFGLSIAGFLEIVDPKIRTAREANKTYNLPCVLTIPEMKLFNRKTAEKRLIYFIRYIYEALEMRLGDRSPVTVALASSISGEGKSTLAYFLGSYYRKIGRKVVILEFDPGSHPFFEDDEVAPKVIEEYLRREATLDEIVYTGETLSRVKGGGDFGMKELIKSPVMKELMTELRSRFDVVIIDVPGIVEEDYAFNLMEFADDSIFVVGSSKVNRDHVDSSLQECDFHGIRPLGIVLNRALKIFIDDVRIQAESKKSRSRLRERLFSWISRD